MNLHAFLELCDPNMKVAITNENGTGGASYVAWPEHGWTVREAIEELGCGGYHLCGVSIHGDMLYIEADENPWDFGSYWNGSFFYGEQHGYRVSMKAVADTVESCEEDAIDQVKMMIEGGDVEFDFEVVRDDSIIHEW